MASVAIVDRNHRNSLADLRSLQDWFLRYQLESVPGVAEVATLGGFVRQYQVRLDPNKMREFNIPLSMVIDRVRDSTNEVGGRLISWLPAAHIAERMAHHYIPVIYAGTITTCSNPREVLSYLPQVRPTWFFHSARTVAERAFSKELATLAESAGNRSITLLPQAR